MLELQVIDAFADAPFAGNPAAVTLLARYPADEWMQDVAREMNLSETAYLVRRADGDHDLRWFTPAAEVDLCGHATLASAHFLGGQARFHTRSGLLECHLDRDGFIEMDFPADPPEPTVVPIDLPGAKVVAAGRGRFDHLVEVSDAKWLRSYQPDQAAIVGLDGRGLIITAAGDLEGIDFVSRVFAPAVGIAEDPVTGSAHCTLASYWATRTGHDLMIGYQASARGGTVRMRLAGDRVMIAGRAVTVSDVRMHVDPPM